MNRVQFLSESEIEERLSERSAAIGLAARANQALAKASERHLPDDERRQAISFVEQRLGRALTTSESERFAKVAQLAPHMVPGDDPVELTPVRSQRRMSFTDRSHVSAGIKGGEGHSGAELEQAAVLLPVLALFGAAILGLACFL